MKLSIRLIKQKLLNIGNRCLAEGKPGKMVNEVYKLKMIETEKLKKRGPVLYDYIANELARSQAKLFTDYYFKTFKK
jgi:hypothetical protein